MNIKLAAMDAEIPSSIGIRLCLILSPSHPNMGDPAILCVFWKKKEGVGERERRGQG